MMRKKIGRIVVSDIFQGYSIYLSIFTLEQYMQTVEDSPIHLLAVVLTSVVHSKSR